MSAALPLVRLVTAGLGAGSRNLLYPVSLELAVGERVCITGAPASGKSLLLEVLAGRHALSTGQRSYPAFAHWHSDAALGVAPRFAVRLVSTEEQRRLAAQLASFHQARWHAQFSKPDTVDAFLEARRVVGLNEFEIAREGLLCPNHDARKHELMQELGIAHLLGRRVAALSNGEMRKLLILAAILARPRLLLLDDPLGGLDSEARVKVIDTLARLCQFVETAATGFDSRTPWLESGQALTLVVATPRPEELAPLVTRTLHLESKRVSAPTTTPEQSRPRESSGDAKEHSSPPRSCILGNMDGDESPSFATARRGASLVRLSRARIAVPGTTILDDVSFEVHAGEHWLITGPNGSGKSTLLALLLGDHPQSYVVDLEVLGLRAVPGVSRFDRQQRLGFMAPELAMHYPPGWTVRDVVLSGFRATIGQFDDVSRTERDLAESWMNTLDLAPHADKALGSLSEATLRQTLLARALIRKPTLLLLDEPTQGLSRSERQKLHDLLDAVAARNPVTLLLVSHHPEERPQCMSHHLALYSGRVTFQGPLNSEHRA